MTDHRSAILIAAMVALSAVTFGIIGVGAQETETPVGTETPTEESTGTQANESASVTFENQTSNGSSVNVSSATLPEGGFIVVYNSTLTAPLGNSSYVESGSQEEVSVQLNESLTEDQTLIAVAFMDTDGDQQFTSGTDEVYISDGELVAASANVTVSDSEGGTTDDSEDGATDDSEDGTTPEPAE